MVNIMKCPDCGATSEIKLIPSFYKNKIYLGEFEAEVCTKCDARYYTEKGFSKIQQVAIELKIWGENALKMPRTENTVSGHKQIHTILPSLLYPMEEIYPIREMMVTCG